MTKEYNIIEEDGQTIYVFEMSSAGGTSAGSVATVGGNLLGTLRRRTQNEDDEDTLEGFSLIKTSSSSTANPKVKNIAYEIVNNKNGEVVGNLEWTSKKWIMKVSLKNGFTKLIDIRPSEKENPQTALNRVMKAKTTPRNAKDIHYQSPAAISETSTFEKIQTVIDGYQKIINKAKQSQQQAVTPTQLNYAKEVEKRARESLKMIEQGGNIDDSWKHFQGAGNVEESAPETPELKLWDVVILNNYYNGKYPDYSGRPYPVLATSAEEAKQVVLDNADSILQDLLSKKLASGKRLLPPNSAIPITAKNIGAIDSGDRKKRTSTGYIKLLSPQGPLMAKLDQGMVVDIQSQGKDIKQKLQRPETNAEKDYASKHGFVEDPKTSKKYKDQSAERTQGVAEGLVDSNTQDAIVNTVEKLFRKNEINDYGALEAIRQGVKHHFTKPNATTESAIEGILNILDKRMRKSGNYLDLSRFKEALRQGVAHQLKKQGVVEGPERKDMTGQTCEKCKKDKYRERSQHDDMEGKVTCSCGHRIDRWRTYKKKDEKQGMAEGSSKSVSFRDMINVVDEHYPKYYAELSGSDISDEEFKQEIIRTYNEIINKQGMAEIDVKEGMGYISDRRAYFNLRNKSVDELQRIINDPTQSEQTKKLASRILHDKRSMQGNRDFNFSKNKNLPEGTGLSPELLAKYKKAAGADASKADKEGDFERGNKRFSGIVKATKKEFDNDAKKVKSEGLPGGLSGSDYMPGQRKEYTNKGCKTCHGRGAMYKLDRQLYPDRKVGSTRIECPTCHGSGERATNEDSYFENLYGKLKQVTGTRNIEKISIDDYRRIKKILHDYQRDPKIVQDPDVRREIIKQVNLLNLRAQASGIPVAEKKDPDSKK